MCHCSQWMEIRNKKWGSDGVRSSFFVDLWMCPAQIYPFKSIFPENMCHAQPISLIHNWRWAKSHQFFYSKWNGTDKTKIANGHHRNSPWPTVVSINVRYAYQSIIFIKIQCIVTRTRAHTLAQPFSQTDKINQIFWFYSIFI